MTSFATQLSILAETSFGLLIPPDLIEWVIVFGAAQLLLFLYIAIALSQRQIKAMKKFIHDLLRDKDGEFNLRDLSSFVFLLLIIFSWAAETFFGLIVPEYLVLLLFAGIGIGKVGYSIERKSPAQ